MSLLLAAVFLGESACPPVPARAQDTPSPCLLLKYSAASFPDELARSWMEEFPKNLREELRVRWVDLPSPPQPDSGEALAPKAADPETLARISRAVADARARLQDMDLREARERLAEADGEARTLLLADPVKPIRAEILLLQGILLLWEGDKAGAESAFARSRFLRPGFTPDPALFSPSVRDTWSRASEKEPPEAELVIHSVPPGAGIFVDGRREGTTPGRVKVRSAGPVRLTVLLPGFCPYERTGQWLPGDSEMLEAVLLPDRLAGLGEMLASSADGGGGAGPLLSGLASESGAERIAILVLGQKEGKPTLDVFSFSRGAAAPVLLGRLGWEGGRAGAVAVTRDAARLLIAGGWPAASETKRAAAAPWYHRWWLWGLLGAVVAGAALGIGGGGGDGSGESTGTIGVDF